MKGTIDIRTVLDDMSIASDKNENTRYFGIRYVNAQGEIHERKKCRLNAKKQHLKKESTGQPKRLQYSLQNTGNVLLHDEDKGEFRSIKAAHMIAFRPHGSAKWYKIWH